MGQNFYFLIQNHYDFSHPRLNVVTRNLLIREKVLPFIRTDVRITHTPQRCEHPGRIGSHTQLYSKGSEVCLSGLRTHFTALGDQGG